MYWILYLSGSISQLVDISNIMTMLKLIAFIKKFKCQVGQVGECKILRKLYVAHI